jgi:NAD(P)-dependent dehydrogenase (short-subunit alcohol dehydrogenase family)
MTDIFDMTGKRVLITGGATGLGFAAANALARYGAEVILAARRIDRIEASVAAIKEKGGCARGIALDVSDSNSISEALEKIQQAGRIDVLINNAGVVGDKMLIEEAAEDWDRIYNTNLRAIFTLSQAVAQSMAADQTGGNIINMASILGYTTQKGTATYASAKAALIQLTRSMAVEWARYDIRVNAIAPGYFRTELADDWLDSEGGQNMIKRAPLRRTGVPHELEGVVLLLASSAGGYMTGSVVTVDGGLSIPQI